jgi:hypothetical protein
MWPQKAVYSGMRLVLKTPPYWHRILQMFGDHLDKRSQIYKGYVK